MAPQGCHNSTKTLRARHKYFDGSLRRHLQILTSITSYKIAVAPTS